MKEAVEVYGERVRQARVMRRLTAKAVAAELGWAPARLTRLEQSAATELPGATFAALAGLLRFPPKFFVTEPLVRVHSSDLLFRAPKSTTKTEKEYLAQFAALVGEFLDELHSRWRLPAVKLPMIDPSTPTVDAALQVRAALGVGPDEPFDYLVHVVEQAGVPVVVRRLLTTSDSADMIGVDHTRADKHLGYSTRVGDFRARPLIVVRQSPSWERTRWTLAHEVGHLVLHASGDVTEDKEEQASRFASELLAPASCLRTEVGRTPSLMSLLPVKRKWGISIGALLRHLYSSDLIDEDRFRSLQRQLYQRVNPETGQTWGRTEPGWNDREVERPRLLSKWIELGFSVSSAQPLQNFDLIFPPDVLAEFVVGQRQAPSRAGAPSARPPAAPAPAMGEVVDFSRFQRSRQA